MKQLVAGYVAQLSNANDLAMLAAVQRAAELVVVSEQLRAKALRGEAVDLGELVRIEGACDRALRRLGIDHKAREPAGPTLQEYLRDRYGGGERPAGESKTDPARGIAAGEQTRTGEAHTADDDSSNGDDDSSAS